MNNIFWVLPIISGHPDCIKCWHPFTDDPHTV